jgi:hypothetical protein
MFLQLYELISGSGAAIADDSHRGVEDSQWAGVMLASACQQLGLRHVSSSLM